MQSGERILRATCRDLLAAHAVGQGFRLIRDARACSSLVQVSAG
jgi:hypothetical protein